MNQLTIPAYKAYLGYTAATGFAFALMTTVSSLYAIETVHLTAYELLIVGFTLEVTCFLFEVPTGALADVYSRKLSMAIGLALMGLGFLLMAAVPEFWAVLAAQVLWGSGITFMSGADSAWIADELGNDALQRVFLRGTQVAQVATLCGIVVSVLLAFWGLRTPLFVSGILYLVYALLVYRFLPENVDLQRKTETAETEPSHVADSATPEGANTPHLTVHHRLLRQWESLRLTLSTGLRTVWQRPLLLVIIAIGVVTGLYSEGLDRLWTLHLLNTFSFPALGRFHDVIWFGMITGGALFLNVVVVAWLERRLERKGKLAKVWVLLLLNTLLMAGISLFALSSGLSSAIAFYWLVQILRGTSDPLYAALLNEQIEDSSVRATVLSSQGQLYAFGEIAGGLIIAFVVWRTTVVRGLLTSSAILLFAVILYVYLLRQLRRKPLKL